MTTKKEWIKERTIIQEAKNSMIRVAADWNKNSRIRLTNMKNAMNGPNCVLFS
jgi:hypothetical protein